jgi:hypothetical protein
MSNVLIDAGVTDMQGAFTPSTLGNLLRAPLPLEKVLDTTPSMSLYAHTAACLLGPMTRYPMSHFGPITPTMNIAFWFATDGGGSASQLFTDLSNGEVRLAKGVNLMTFFLSEVMIGHGATPTWWLERHRLLHLAHSSQRGGVELLRGLS